MLGKEMRKGLLEFSFEFMDNILLAFFVDLLFVGFVYLFFFLLEFGFTPESFFIEHVLNGPVTLDFLRLLSDLRLERVFLADT